MRRPTGRLAYRLDEVQRAERVCLHHLVPRQNAGTPDAPATEFGFPNGGRSLAGAVFDTIVDPPAPIKAGQRMVIVFGNSGITEDGRKLAERRRGKCEISVECPENAVRCVQRAEPDGRRFSARRPQLRSVVGISN